MNADQRSPEVLHRLPHTLQNSSENQESPGAPESGLDTRDDAGVSSPTRRREFRWSKAARDLVRANLRCTGNDLSCLVDKLVRETGYPRWACRRFMRRLGIKSVRPHRAWTTGEQQRLLKLVDLQPVNEIARLMRRSKSSIWHMLYRLGANAKMGKDSFTKYTLAVALHVRPETVESWINRGWLKARTLTICGVNRIIIEAADFCEFCQTHTKDVVGNRLTKERLDFICHFAFPASHTELLPVRESKKERAAFDRQCSAPGIPKESDIVEASQKEDELGMIA